jgi:hypothetical protein
VSGWGQKNRTKRDDVVYGWFLHNLSYLLESIQDLNFRFSIQIMVQLLKNHFGKKLGFTLNAQPTRNSNFKRNVIYQLQ